VTDVADAMVLRRLFEELIKQGVLVVLTSNQHPTSLYEVYP
jgi:protein AFG1